MPKSLFTPKESSDIVLAAYQLQIDQNNEKFLAKVERVLLDKLAESAETERLLGLTPKSS